MTLQLMPRGGELRRDGGGESNRVERGVHRQGDPDRDEVGRQAGRVGLLAAHDQRQGLVRARAAGTTATWRRWLPSSTQPSPISSVEFAPTRGSPGR
jgi:hypothetical protein